MSINTENQQESGERRVKLPVRIKQYYNKRINSIQKRLERFFAYRLIKQTIQNFLADHALDRSSAVSYYGVFSIFPLLMGMVSILGFFLPSEDVKQVVSDALLQVFPNSLDVIEQSLDNVVRLRGPGAIISILALFWSGTGIFSVINRKLNYVWDIKEERPYIKRKLLHMGMALGAGVLMILWVAIPVVIELFSHLDSPVISWIISISSIMMGLIIIFTTLLLIYRILPNMNTTWKMVWPGALLGSVLLETAIHGYAWYLTNIADYSSVYGSFASIIILLFGAYICAIILLSGIEFNATLYRMRKED